LAYKDFVLQPSLAKRLKRWVRYWAVRLALAVIGRLPVRAAARLGEAFGGVAFHLVAGERRKALESLAVAFPEKTEREREAIALSSFRHLGRSTFENACLPKLDHSLNPRIEWPAADRQRLEQAVRRGRGVVLVTGHVGNWELLAQFLIQSGVDGVTVAKELSDPRLTALLDDFRAQGGVRSLWRGADGTAKSILRALRSGQVIGILIDQDTDVQSVFVPFFGQLAATPRAAADLVLRTSAPVVTAFCQREQDGGYRVSIEEVAFDPTGEREADVVSLTAKLTSRIEDAIRRAPEQWVWMHRRWKTQP